MEALLEEPEVEQQEVTRIDKPIPTATFSEVYFDAEHGVDGEDQDGAVEGEPEEEGEMTEGEIDGSEGEDEGEECSGEEEPEDWV
jgi:hypothetical protein